MSSPEVSHLLPPIPIVFPIVDGSWELRIMVTDLQVQHRNVFAICPNLNNRIFS